MRITTLVQVLRLDHRPLPLPGLGHRPPLRPRLRHCRLPYHPAAAGTGDRRVPRAASCCARLRWRRLRGAVEPCRQIRVFIFASHIGGCQLVYDRSHRQLQRQRLLPLQGGGGAWVGGEKCCRCAANSLYETPRARGVGVGRAPTAAREGASWWVETIGMGTRRATNQLHHER